MKGASLAPQRRRSGPTTSRPIAGKTFEMFTLTGYPPPSAGLSASLEVLSHDVDPAPSPAAVEATYGLLQQLVHMPLSNL
jgi:hypothetical protein